MRLENWKEAWLPRLPVATPSTPPHASMPENATTNCRGASRARGVRWARRRTASRSRARARGPGSPCRGPRTARSPTERAARGWCGAAARATSAMKRGHRHGHLVLPRADSVRRVMSAVDVQPSRVRTPRGGWPAALGAVVLVGAATLALPATLGYDAWAWTVWGRQLAHLDLATTAGPSFKPLPVLALAPLWIIGAATPVVWMGLMRAAAVLSLLLAYRLGARLAGPLAGAVAALGLALSADLYRTALLGSAEPVLIALTLGAADRHLAGRRDWALVLIASGRAHPARGPGSCSAPTASSCGCASPACARSSRPPWSCPPCCGWGWAPRLGQPAARQLDRDLGHRGQRRQRQGARGSRWCAAPRTRSSSPRSSWRPSGWPSRRAAAIARCCRSPTLALRLDRGGRDHGRGRVHRHPALPGGAGGGAVRRGRGRAGVAVRTPSASGVPGIALGVAVAALALVPALLRAREDARMLSVARSQADQRHELVRGGRPRRRPRRRAARRAPRDQPVAADRVGLGARRPALGRAGDLVVVAAPPALGAAGARLPRPGAAGRAPPEPSPAASAPTS